MSLSRAFTTRRFRRKTEDGTDDVSAPRRSNSVKGPILRHKISAPIQLIHTTNMLSYNAPDLPRTPRTPVSASRDLVKSDDDSDTLTTDSTPPTSPDVTPGKREREREPSPTPKPNHLTMYFQGSSKQPAADSDEPPAIPKRSPSHTKKNSFEALARSRSMSRGSRDSELSIATKPSHVFSRTPSTSTRASSASGASSPTWPPKQTAPPPTTPPAVSRPQSPSMDAHPFGQELAQVTELAEEYNTSGCLQAIDEEEQYLDARGLVKLSADDYLGAIRGISTVFFPEAAIHSRMTPALWI